MRNTLVRDKSLDGSTALDLAGQGHGALVIGSVGGERSNSWTPFAQRNRAGVVFASICGVAKHTFVIVALVLLISPPQLTGEWHNWPYIMVSMAIQPSTAFADNHCRSADAVATAVREHYRIPIRIVWIRWNSRTSRYLVRIDSEYRRWDVEVKLNCEITELSGH